MVGAKAMSPNSNHHLDSYQHCSEHEASNVDDDFENDHSISIDVGVGNHQSRHNSNRDGQTNAKPFSSSDPPRRRINRRVELVLLVGALSLGVGLFASDVVFRSDESDAADRIPDLIWSDEFDGDSIDSTKWTFVNGDGCDVGLCGWGNNELERYAPSNARVSDGTLTIEARKVVAPGGPSGYTSSKIITRGKADFGVVGTAVDEETTSGERSKRSRRFESRLKLPWGHGIWPAFWMLPTREAYGGWPKSGEIDIMENIGKEGPNTVHGTVHYGLDWPQHQYHESGITLAESKTSPPSHAPSSGSLNETFHTFAVERLPGVIRWYIDDVEYSSITKEDVHPYRWPFDEEFYFILNLAVGGNWPGDPLDEDDSDGDATVFPQRLEVDYVRVYEGVFPRVTGKRVVGCSERNVAYEVENVQGAGTGYAWTVPRNATIVEGQGTARIVVDYDSTMTEGDVIDGEVVRVRATGVDDRDASAGQAKLRENGVGARVKIVDFDGKCSPPNQTSAELAAFDFDCGRPSECDPFVLCGAADGFTCGERIEWLMDENGMDEREACEEIGYVQFHGQCGPCDPSA